MHHRPHGAKPRASLNTSRIIYTLGYQQPAENIMKAENKKKRDGKKRTCNTIWERGPHATTGGRIRRLISDACRAEIPTLRRPRRAFQSINLI